MSHDYTSNFKEKTGSTSGEEPVYLLEITHPELSAPARVVNDTQDIVSNGDTYTACGFRIALPDDFADQMPRANLSIDNVGRELTQWLEASNGGKGASVRVMQIMRDAPDVIEADYTLDLLNVKQNVLEISASLGYENTLNAPGLIAYYRPDNTPNIF